ncbi:MAG: AAA family ATPase [Acidimicrobiia bacterium]
MRRFITTGAPGTGKTSLLGELATFADTIDEPARELIAEHQATTGEASLDGRPELFVERLIERSLEKYNAAGSGNPIRLYDRGLPDCIAYARVLGTDASEAERMAARYRYEEPVFLLPPWREIYHVDEMRGAEFWMVEEFHTALVAAYGSFGYELMVLPNTTISDRAALVRTVISSEDS